MRNFTINIDPNIRVMAAHIAYYKIDKKTINVILDGGSSLLFNYDDEESARRNFDAIDKIMNRYYPVLKDNPLL